MFFAVCMPIADKGNLLDMGVMFGEIAIECYKKKY
jgi:hypothetical protein